MNARIAFEFALTNKTKYKHKALDKRLIENSWNPLVDEKKLTLILEESDRVLVGSNRGGRDQNELLGRNR